MSSECIRKEDTCRSVFLESSAFTRLHHSHKYAAGPSSAWWTCHIPCAHIRTAEVHPALIIEAERAYVAIAIQHVLILLLATLKPAINSHTDAGLSYTQTICNKDADPSSQHTHLAVAYQLQVETVGSMCGSIGHESDY